CSTSTTGRPEPAQRLTIRRRSVRLIQNSLATGSQFVWRAATPVGLGRGIPDVVRQSQPLIQLVDIAKVAESSNNVLEECVWVWSRHVMEDKVAPRLDTHD